MKQDLTFDIIKHYIAGLTLEDLYMKGESIIVQGLLERHHVQQDMIPAFKASALKAIAKAGIKFAHEGYKNGDQELTEKGLGIACCATESNGSPIAFANAVLGQNGLQDADLQADKFQELSFFANTGKKGHTWSSPTVI